MFKKIVNRIIKMREYDSRLFFDILIYSITITAFLVAFNVFTAKKSLKIQVRSNMTGYFIDNLLGHYDNLGIELPRVLIEDKSIGHIFKPKKKIPRIEYFDQGGILGPYIETVKEISNGYEDDDIWWLIDKLKERIKSKKYTKRIFGSNISRGFYREEDIGTILNIAKEKLNDNDYFTFLSLFIYSREIGHHIYVDNNGDVDLKEILITIPAPISKITEKRDGNILSFSFNTNLIHDAKLNDDNLQLSIPKLGKNDFFSCDINVRENEVNEREIF